MKDPLAGSGWSDPGTVAGFAQSQPNATLMEFAAGERRRGGRRLLDIGAGAGRNAIPLARQGWAVAALDLSWPMLVAAGERARHEAPDARVETILAPMECLPIQSGSIDLIVAHGIWNLARSGSQFRAAVAEAARVAGPGAGLFVFTFSRNTLAEHVRPVPGEPFVFTEFSGQPQCFLTAGQLADELLSAGFIQDDAIPMRELNRRSPDTLARGGPPVIYEAAFRRSN